MTTPQITPDQAGSTVPVACTLTRAGLAAQTGRWQQLMARAMTERAKTAALLKQIIKNRSVIVIEHDMQFVESIAHRVTVMHQGKVLAEGDMQSVQNNPKVKEVYLGH